MLALLFITILLLALYWRTMDYRYLIDDNVRRWGYLLDVPETSPPVTFYQKDKPSAWRHLFLTITHILNVWVIYLIWGWQPAFLFAVYPLCVSCTAWITGGYYQVTTFLTLTSLYFIFHWPGLVGSALGAVFFTAALGSTINCISVPFMFLFFPPISGLLLFWPLGFYLFGHRFGVGFRKRDAGKADYTHPRKLAVVVKVMAYYIWVVLYPKRLGFFREFGFDYMRKGEEAKIKMESFNKEFWISFALLATFAIGGWTIHPFGTAWFLITLAPFSQWKVLGQFVAERYLYLPSIGIILLIAKICSIHPVIFWAVFLVYLYRSHTYIPTFKNVFTLYESGIKNFPKCVSNYVNLAEQELHRGDFIKAGKLLNIGLKLDPDSFLCYANLSAFWLAVKDWNQALYCCEKALTTCDRRGMAYRVFSQQKLNIDNVKKQALEAKEKDEKRAKELEAEELASSSKSMEVENESVATSVEIIPT